MPVINQSKQRDALQPVGTLQNYEVPWCPNPYSNVVQPDLGPPKFAVVTQRDGSVVATLQRQVAFVPSSGAATTCTNPATLTTAAYTDKYTLVPGTAQASAPLQTLSGFACQGPLAWKVLPYSYDALNGVVVDDGGGNGQAVAAALRLQVPYLPSGVAGGAGCAATVFATHAVTDFAYLAPGTITALPAPSTHPTTVPTTGISVSANPSSSLPVASPTGSATPSNNAAVTNGRIAASVGAVLLGAIIIGGFFVVRSVKRRRARADLAAEAARTPDTGSLRTQRRPPPPLPPKPIALQDYPHGTDAM